MAKTNDSTAASTSNAGRYQVHPESTDTTPLVAPPPYDAFPSSTPQTQPLQSYIVPPVINPMHIPGGHYYVPAHNQQPMPSMPGLAPMLVHTVHVNASNLPIGCQVTDGRLLLPIAEPVRMYCPYDRCEVLTTVERTPGCFAYSMSAFLCCVFWPAFCLPFCMDRCQDKIHRCTLCGHTLAIASD